MRGSRARHFRLDARNRRNIDACASVISWRASGVSAYSRTKITPRSQHSASRGSNGSRAKTGTPAELAIAARSPCGINGRTEWHPSQLNPTIFSITPITVVEHNDATSNAARDARTEISDGCVTISARSRANLSNAKELIDARGEIDEQ